MATVTLGTLRDYWKKVSDWVDGTDTVSSPSVKLTGRKMQTIVSSRSVKSASQGLSVDIPDWGPKGCVVTVRVYGVTGTFSSGQGLSLDTTLVTGYSTNRTPVIRGNQFTTTGYISHIWHPGASFGDAVNNRLETKISGLMAGKEIYIGLIVSGTFATGEGFDCEVIIDWL